MMPYGMWTSVDASEIRPARVLIPALLSSLLLCPLSLSSQDRAHDLTCDKGSGEYSTRFSTGVTVSVGPVRNGGFAERACEAKLAWNSQELHVASSAAQVGIDVLGADLGFGIPVVAFEVGNSGVASQRTYQIYSLTKSPRLLQTISGGDSYSAADSDLDGQIEVWSDDATGVDGFEHLPLSALDFAPTVVLRFEKGGLIDVSSEFRSYYDAQIADIRSHLDPRDLGEFKSSDGVLSFSLAMSSCDELPLANGKSFARSTTVKWLQTPTNSASEESDLTISIRRRDRGPLPTNIDLTHL